MNTNWKRLFTTLGIIVVSTSILGYLTWSGMTKIINSQEVEIQLLTNKSAKLSQQYVQKSQEKKAAEAAKAAKTTQKTQSNTASDETTTSDTNGTTNQGESVPQSQILYFYNPSCGACIAQEPVVLELQSEGIPFVFCNSLVK